MYNIQNIYNALYGEFNRQGIFVDMKNNKENWNILSTSVHEMTHSFLEFDSYLGQIEFLFQQIIIHPSTTDRIRAVVKSYMGKLYDSSICVQESVAVFTELSFLALFDASLMEQECASYKNNSDYYKKYKFKELEDFLQDKYERDTNPLNSDQICHRVEIVLKIAKCAMDINIFAIDYTKENNCKLFDNQKDCYNPNIRFFKVIDYIKNHSILIDDLIDEDIYVIFNKLECPCIGPFDKDRMRDWANSNLLPKWDLDNYSNYVVFEELENIEELLYTVNPYVSDKCYKTYIKKNIKKDDIINSDYYAYIEDEPYYWSLINIRENKIIKIGKEFDVYAAKRIHRIYTDRSSFPNLMGLIKKNEFEIYVNLCNWDFLAKNFINAQGIDGYIFYTLAEKFSILLYKGINNITFFITMPTYNINGFENLYLKKYRNLEDWWWDKGDLIRLVAFITKTPKGEIRLE